MDSHVIAADLASGQAEYSSDDHRPQKSKSCSDQKQRVLGQLIIPPSVLCFSCAQPRWESEWNFSIEDMVPIDNSKSTLSSFKTADLMKEKEKAGKSQKMRKKMGRVIYHRPPRALLSA